MTAATKPVTRQELQTRLDAIENRIQTRAAELADIHRRQLAAATDGQEPGAAIATSKNALVDAQGIDEQAAAGMRAEIDQLLAAEQREQGLVELAKARREAAAAARAAQVAGDAYPATWAAVLAAVREHAAQLCAGFADIRTAVRVAEAAAARVDGLAGELGEVGAPPVVDPTLQLGHLGAVPAGLQINDMTTAAAQLFSAVEQGNVRAAGERLGVAAFLTVPAIGEAR